MKSFYVAIFVAYFYVQATSATPFGAPTKACTSMSPGHLVSGSTTDYIKTQSLSNSRYSVATMAKNYSAGSVVKGIIFSNIFLYDIQYTHLLTIGVNTYEFNLTFIGAYFNLYISLPRIYSLDRG